MKVKELIEKLQQLPQDEVVKMEDLANPNGYIDIQGAGNFKKGGIIIIGFH